MIKAQTGALSGTISLDDGDVAIGANVYIKALNQGVTTGIDGSYNLTGITTGKFEVTISYIGYKSFSKLIDFNNKTIQFDTTLMLDGVNLDQVVVVGYGTQIKKEISSSIVTLNADEIKDKPSTNFSSSLQGKAAGVQITSDNGAAGASTSIRIRGVNTLSGGAEPLYVIDGIPLMNDDISESSSRNGYNISPLSLINPNDIENITILKDASATAIYGSRGANGVILITTKSGTRGKPKLKIDVSSGVSSETNRITMLNSKQYVDLYQQAWQSDGNDPSELTEINGINLDSVANTDWIDEVLQVGQFVNANLSLNGGKEQLNYYLGSSYRNETTFLKGNQFERITLKGNINYKPIKSLRVTVNTNLGNTNNKYALTGSSGGLGRAQSEALPIYPVYNEDGSYFWLDNGGGLRNLNPLAEINLLDNRGNTYRLLNNVKLTYDFSENISFNNEFGLDLIDQHEKFFTPKEIEIKTDSNDVRLSTLEDRHINYQTWNYNSTLQLQRKIRTNKLSVLGGFSTQYLVENYEYSRVSGADLTFDSNVNDATYNEYSVDGKGQEYASLSYFTRTNYTIKEKYLLQLSYRTDGSSRFGSNNKYGHFGAFSFGWIMSDERFLENANWLNLMKLRLSTGTRGNDNIGNFNQFSYFTPNQNYAGQSGIGPDNPSVSDLKWETVFTTDLGIDFGILENRFSGTLEYYYTKSSDVLVSNTPLSPSSGYTSVVRNLGEVESSGLEFQITSNNLSPKRKLKWKTEFNISHYTNKVLSLGGLEEVSGTNYGENRAIVGQPVGVFFLAEFAGIDEETGQEMIYDLKGNRVELTAANSVSERKVMGKPYPDFYGGLNNHFEYKNFGINLFLVYSVGQKIYDDHGKRQFGNLAFGWNQNADILSSDDVPELSLAENRDINSSRHLHDASFLRLRDITISYKFSKKVCKKLRISDFRWFLSFQNAFVWTNYEGWDPEVNREGSGAITQGVSYLSPPQSKIISTGVNITF
ncbi:MAG: SusC/RagA family TonB-linked outer membrane protein [Bacteroidota bacterium]|nr:SusC/RagA family TonB-linked outer membrane protein [Bacteroidota bacterium]